MMNEIRIKAEEVFTKLFPEANELSEETSSGDIHKWDSLNHIVLISEIEKKFEIKFDIFEILSMQSFGEICKAVENKLNS